MGEPKLLKKLRKHPKKPKDNLVEEKNLNDLYYYNQKHKLSKVKYILQKIKNNTKSVIGRLATQKNDEYSLLESKKLLNKLHNYKLINKETQGLEDILMLNEKDIMSRWFQNICYSKGLAKSLKHARQMIVHGHIYLGEAKCNIPSYILSRNDEAQIRISSKYIASSEEIAKKSDETEKENTIINDKIDESEK